MALKNIRVTCGLGNAGGLGNILYFTKKSEVTAIVAPLAGTHEIAGATPFTMLVSPAGTFKALELTPIPGKKTWETPQEGDADSPSWGVNITGFHPKTDPVKGDGFTSMVGCEYIVVALDKNGKRRVVGDTLNGAFFTVKEMIQEGVNGYEVTVTIQGLNHLPYFLADAAVLTVAADA